MSSLPLSQTRSEEFEDYPSYHDVILKTRNYDPLVSPFEKTRKTMNMTVSLPLVILVSVDESRQIITYIAAANITWYDPRLKFDPDELGYQAVLIPSLLVWIPPVEAFNNIELKISDREYPSGFVTINHAGIVSITIRGKYDTVCRCDVEAFPFDTQECSLNFVGLFPIQQATLTPVVETQLLVGLPEWEISGRIGNLTYDTNDGKTFSMARNIFKLERNPQFYIYFLIIPTVIITFTCMSALLLPLGIKEGEKANIGLSGLLGLTFMLSIIVVQIPRSTKLPLLGKWLIIQMGYCLMAMTWEFPLIFLRKFLNERYVKSKRGKDRLSRVLATGSAFVFLASDLIVTGVMFSTAKSTPPPGDKIL